MASNRILVFGATGPAGILLLRELLHRGHAALAYCRNPAKLPKDLVSNPLLEVVEGQMTQQDALSGAIAKSRAVISLLGPSSVRQPKDTEFADYYKTIVPLMKEHGVGRLLALGTTAMYLPEDQGSISRAIMSTIIKVVASGAYQNILAIQEFFEQLNDPEINWTVFRLGNLSGTAEAAAWNADREGKKASAGHVGGHGFTSGINRSILAQWLADAATADPPTWVQQMPAVSG